jgi:copper(I)-binding protein
MFVCGCLGAAHAAVRVDCGSLQESARGAAVAIGYFSVTNTGPEERELLKITSPLAERISLRQSSADAQGVEHEWPIASLHLPPGHTVRFAPENGRHLVLEGLSAPLHARMRVPITLQFDGGVPPVTLILVWHPSKVGISCNRHR